MRLKNSKIVVWGVVIALFALVNSAMAINWDSGFDKGKLPANQITTDTTNFSKNLSSADTDVQKALETLDQLVSGGGSMTWPAAAGIALYSGASTWSASISGTSSQLVVVGLHVAAQLVESLVMGALLEVCQFVYRNHFQELGRRILEQRGDADLAFGLQA